MNEEILAIIRETLGVETDALGPESDFFFLDSLELLELFMEIESRFGVKVTDEVKGKINTLGELAEYVESHRS